MVILSPPDGEASITSPPDTSYTIVNHESSPECSSESEAALSDAEEEHTPQQESVSTPGSNLDEEEVSSNSSSDEDVEGQSEDGDYEVETPVEEPTEENGYESATKSAKESRKSTKIRVADDYNENPDLYGQRLSVKLSNPITIPTFGFKYNHQHLPYTNLKTSVSTMEAIA